MNPSNFLTTADVAERLGVTQARVRALIAAGRLPSKQYGRDHLIRERDLELVADRRPGRPRKDEKAKRTAEAPVYDYKGKPLTRSSVRRAG
jgi:excisionase family DNA binding protein